MSKEEQVENQEKLDAEIHRLCNEIMMLVEEIKNRNKQKASEWMLDRWK